jgi:methionyl-tRNA formyltransferase
MGTPLDLVFMGTPEFAATIFARLITAGHRLRAVYTQPPRPAGRGHRTQPSPVQLLAENHGLPVHCPTSLRDAGVQAEFAAPRLGCLNVHASLLPRWRGAAPIQRAILAGDRETGVTIMQMDEGLDTGPMLLQRAVPILPDTTAGELTDILAELGGRLMLEALDGVAAGKLSPQPQPEAGVAYAPKIRREEARLDWRQPADVLERQVRAFASAPGAWFTGGGERIRVLQAAAEAQAPNVPPGTVIDDRLAIACGNGVLRPLRLQRPGRGALDADAFLRGFPIPAGTLLPCPATS